MFRPDPPALSTPAAARMPVAILGAGITGLTAAYQLHKAGVAVRVFEAGPRVGGAIGSVREEGWLRELGPNTIQLNSRALTTLFDDLGLTPRMLEANPQAKKRYLVRRGRPCAVPISPFSFLASPLFSPAGKIRLFRDLTYRARERSGDISLADFVADHFGEEVVRNAFSAFVSGVYAGDASRLSARLSFPSLWRAERLNGSLLRGLMQHAKERRRAGEPKTRLISFPEGLQEFPQALVRALPANAIETTAEVSHLQPPQPGGSWIVRWSRNGIPETAAFSAVISALPAQALAKISMGHDALVPFASLAEIESPPVTSLFLGFRREDVAHALDGFGMLTPPQEKREILGVLFSSTLFPGRSPEGTVALTVMIGGANRPGAALADDAALLGSVRRELADLLGVKGEPLFVRRATWPQAIPQYTLGYERFLDAVELAEHTYPGLYIGGQLRNGISVPQCVDAGMHLAERCLA